MARELDYLGQARVYRDPQNGELVVDSDTLQRDTFGYEPDDVVDAPELGAWRGRDRGTGRRDERRDERRDDRRDDPRGGWGRRDERRDERRDSPARPAAAATRVAAPPPPSGGTARNVGWGKTAVSGEERSEAGGAVTVRIRLQHDFEGQDLTFTGSTSGAKVTSLFFGDRSLWASPDGIDVSVFGSNSFLRGFLEGQSIRSGLDITITGVVGEKGVLSATLFGFKPVDGVC